jgi:UDPglucose 6-dehydrogenase
MKVAVIGTGYVGLVAGACLAETGNDVTCVDIDQRRIRLLQQGEIPIFEPGLHDLVVRNALGGRLTFTTDTKSAVEASLVIFLAVPTPTDEDGSADLQHLLDAAKQVAAGINDYKVIVDKSTVPAGTSVKVHELIAGLTLHPFDVVSNPEFLKEGNAVDDFLKPDRVIIGCASDRARTIMTDLYAPFVRTGHPILLMRPESAELTKYAANAILAVKVSFINEIARLCELVGADVDEVRRGMGTDSRIGPAFLFPGMGFGGSCFPKDIRALDHTAKSLGLDLHIVHGATKANQRQRLFLPDKILDRFSGRLAGRRIAVWGLAFKANTDDVRESPAFTIVDTLLDNKAVVSAYDPQAMLNTRNIYGERITYARDQYSALAGAEALVVATEWNVFRHPNFDRMKNLMKTPLVFDGRNLFDPARMREMGFEYYSVGRV